MSNQFDRNRFDRGRDGRGQFDRDWRDLDNRQVFDRRRSDWQRNGDRIRRDWSGRRFDRVPFAVGWWDNYGRVGWPVYSPWASNWWRDRPYYWWGWTPAAGLTNWLAFNWSRPYYWNYGPGANIYYQDDYVYYDNQPYLPVDAYYQRVHQLAHNVAAADADPSIADNWRPLGVFAAIREGDQGDHRVIQLAVNKNGVITGTYFNPQTEQVHPVSGRVDERSQRVAWSFADGQNPDVVFETSLYNLTEAEATMMVHFGPQASQADVWQLVRLEQPSAGGAAAAPAQPVQPEPLPAPVNSLP